MWRVIFASGHEDKAGISPLEALATSLASRIGTGNLVGVAIALGMGGAGAIFWMWVIAFLGMATAYAESALAQLYKIPHEDGTFRGGPAYYIQRGLKSRFFHRLTQTVNSIQHRQFLHIRFSLPQPYHGGKGYL